MAVPPPTKPPAPPLAKAGATPTKATVHSSPAVPTAATRTPEAGTATPATRTPPATAKPAESAAAVAAPASIPASPPALTVADVILLRNRLEAIMPGATVKGTTPADQIIAAATARLDAARAEDARRIAALEAQVADQAKRLTDLTATAAALTERAAATSDERDAELSDALSATDRLIAAMAAVQKTGDAAAADTAAAKDALGRAEREVADLRAAADPKATGKTVLGAETVAALLNDFVGSFKTRLTGLDVTAGEVSLKAGFAQLGAGAGFILPSALTPASELGVLHDITLRLDPKSL